MMGEATKVASTRMCSKETPASILGIRPSQRDKTSNVIATLKDFDHLTRIQGGARCSKSDTKQMECWPDTDNVHLKSRHADTSRSMLLVFKNNLCHSAMNNLLSKRKIWKSPVTPFARLSLSGREDEDYYDYYYDDEVDRDDKDVSARSRAEVKAEGYLWRNYKYFINCLLCRFPVFVI